MLVGHFVDDDVRGAERVRGIEDPHVAALPVEGKKRLESRDKRAGELQNRICHRWGYLLRQDLTKWLAGRCFHKIRQTSNAL